MRVVFFGTPQFAARVLQYLLEHDVNVVAVISKPDRPKGRSGHPSPTPVKELIKASYPHIPIYQPDIVSAPEFADILASTKADLFVVVAYGEILRQHILDMPRIACINLHASLLPKYRGAAPIQRCLIEGELQTGVTIMHMVKKMDAGDMIAQVTIPIDPNMTFGELDNALCEIGKIALLKVIKEFENDTPTATPQDPNKVTMAPKIELEDCELTWDKPALALHNLVRGVNPHPGAWCYVHIKGEKKRLKILRTVLVQSPENISLPPGQLIHDPQNNRWLIGTGDLPLQLLEVQLEGKKAMPAKEFFRGITPSFS